MMATAAAAFHFSGHSGIADLDVAYLTLQPLLGQAAATVFGLSRWPPVFLPPWWVRWRGRW